VQDVSVKCKTSKTKIKTFLLLSVVVHLIVVFVPLGYDISKPLDKNFSSPIRIKLETERPPDIKTGDIEKEQQFSITISEVRSKDLDDSEPGEDVWEEDYSGKCKKWMEWHK